MSDPMAGMLAALKSFASFDDEVAKEARPAIEKIAKGTAAAGTDPAGKSWVPKKDGTRPLVHAADAITVSAIGRVVQVRLDGVNVLHNFGTNKDPRREIIPSRKDEMPDDYAASLEDAATRVFKRLAGGGA